MTSVNAELFHREFDPKESRCADCGGFDIEWMYKCHRHGLEYCRGCSCPECYDELRDDDVSDPLPSEDSAS
jgi:hypothetical protein